MSAITTETLAAWFAGRLPDDWFTEPPEVTTDREEILVVGRLAEPDYPKDADDAAAAAARARAHRTLPRGDPRRAHAHRRRRRAAHRPQGRVGRAVRRRARRCSPTSRCPVMTRLRMPERAGARHARRCRRRAQPVRRARRGACASSATTRASGSSSSTTRSSPCTKRAPPALRPVRPTSALRTTLRACAQVSTRLLEAVDAEPHEHAR